MRSDIPPSIGTFEIECPEFVYHVYMPIKMAECVDVRIPMHLRCFWPLVEQVMSTGTHEGKYIYLTVKKMHVSTGQTANRPGWHLDGYGTDDHNFIWSDCLPTEFVAGDFDLSEDHEISLSQMDAQAAGRVIHTCGDNKLIWLGPTNVHRVAQCNQDCVRTFVKISVSDHQYNLAGNAHNYLFDYKWDMVDRKPERNHPIGKGD